MPVLTREMQMGYKVEATAGTAETLGAADFVGNRSNMSKTYNVDRYERSLTRGTLTQLESIQGSRSLSLALTEECVGGTSNSSPKWHDLLEICGFQKINVVKFTVTSVTGAFKSGDRVGNNASEASATKVGIVGELAGGTLYIMPITGTFANADAITNYSQTGACTLSSTSAAAGFGFKPLTERSTGTQPKTGTFEVRHAGYIHRAVGAKGSLTMNLQRNQPLMLTANVQGIPLFDVNGKTPVTGSPFGNLAVPGASPKLGLGSVVRFHTATPYAPVFTNIDIDLGQTVALRENANDNQIANSGFLPAQITDRRPTMTVDPEHIVVADNFDAYGLIIGGDVFAVTAKLGLLTDGNGMIVVAAPRTKVTSDGSDGDRNGNTTLPMTLGLFGRDDDELYLFHLFAA